MKRKRTPPVAKRPIHRGIKRARISKGWSQQRLAKELDVHVTAVSHWENGASSPRGALLPVIARKLDTTIGALHGEGAQ